jgi:hypothetical protein
MRSNKKNPKPKLGTGAAHRDTGEWKKGQSRNQPRGDSHCARTAQQNQNFRSENKEENQKGHIKDSNKSFSLKFNKITPNSQRLPSSLPHLIY